MPLAVGQELTLDFELKPAGVQETVTVVGTAPVLDISSARLGVNVSEREVSELPVNGRQMSQLMLQAPGAQNAGTGTWQDIRFSGRANEQNVIKYDGVEGSAIIDASPGNVNGENNTPFKLQASLENVQEFRVESSSYPAEYGTGTGGQVSVITKSGGNAFHGAVFEYLRNERSTRRTTSTRTRKRRRQRASPAWPKSPLKQNQFGGSIGGPLVKDRAFFFGSYEGYRLDAGKNFVEAVPSAAAWARAVPAVAGSAVRVPRARRGDSAGRVDQPGLRHRAAAGRPRRSRRTPSAAALDFKMSSNWSTYVRVFHDQGTSDAPDGVTGRHLEDHRQPDERRLQPAGRCSAAARSTSSSSATTRRRAPIGAIAPPGFEELHHQPERIGRQHRHRRPGRARPASTIPGGLVRVNSAGNGRGAPYDPYSLTFADSMSRLAGNHFMKFGADVRMIRMTTDQLGGITYSFANLAAFLANTPSTIQYFGDLSEPSPFSNGASGPEAHQAGVLRAATRRTSGTCGRTSR